jgi:hypothetical protein
LSFLPILLIIEVLHIFIFPTELYADPIMTFFYISIAWMNC